MISRFTFSCLLIVMILFTQIIHAQSSSDHQFYSEILGEERTYIVSLPDSYNDPSYAHKQYPVLVLLDGKAHLTATIATVKHMSMIRKRNYLMPETIIVAIVNTERERDFTPTKIKMVRKNKTGGGNRFLDFLDKELIPVIDEQYRTMSYRTLIGHSLGGLISLHSYMKASSPFNAYLAIDPSIWWDDEMLKDKLDSVGPERLTGTLFIASVKNNQPRNISYRHQAIYELLKAKDIDPLNVNIKYYTDETHQSVPLPALYDGLKAIYRGYQPSFANDASIEQVQAHYLNVSDRMHYPTLPPESLVNRMGYGHMNRDAEKALAFFQLNVKNYPTSANAFDSLGEAYKKLGKTQEALANYQKSLELNPKNENARMEIEKLSTNNK